MQVTTEQVAILQHTLGLNEWCRSPFRNHYVAGPGHCDMPNLEALEASGLMLRHAAPSFCEPGDIVFVTTDAGRALAIEKLPEPPRDKRSQHQQWLDADTGFSFAEWLCGARLPKYETRGHYSWGTSSTLEYRMYRSDHGIYRDVEGQWARTKKDAKASYKEALKAYRKAAKGVSDAD